MQASADSVPVGVVAELAVRVLVEEAELTPKPALVDQRGGGAHDDMDLDLLRRSAYALRPTFKSSYSSPPLRRAGGYAKILPPSAGGVKRRCSPSPVASTRTAARSGPWVSWPPPRAWWRPALSRRKSRRSPGGWRLPRPIRSVRGVSRLPVTRRYGVAGARGEARRFPARRRRRAAGPADRPRSRVPRAARPPGRARRPDRQRGRHLFAVPRWPRSPAEGSDRCPSCARAGATVPRWAVALCGRWRRRCCATTRRPAAAPTCSRPLFLDALDRAAARPVLEEVA